MRCPAVRDSYTELGDGEITAGGGQFVNCNEMLRFGQLVLNKGKWVDTSSGFSVTTQLIDESYIEAMISPQHPNAINNYGLLTWLSDPGAAPANCCQPQWLCTASGSQQVRSCLFYCCCSCAGAAAVCATPAPALAPAPAGAGAGGGAPTAAAAAPAPAP